MLELLLLTVILVGIGFGLLGIRVLFMKGKKFPNGSVSGVKKLREQNIRCARGEELARFRKLKKQKIDAAGLKLATDK